MFSIWRRLVKWLRSILTALFVTKQPIKWVEKVEEISQIIVDVIKKPESKPDSKPEVKPDTKPNIPDYNIIPKPRRRWFRRLFG